MAWRCVHIGSPSRIHIKNRQLVASQNDGDTTIPIEDIGCVILDTPQTTLTGSTLATLSQAGIVLVQSDATHHPTMMAIPFHGHYKQAEIAQIQIKISAPFSKRIWQHIVKIKITNQNAHLQTMGRQSNRLSTLIDRVQ